MIVTDIYVKPAPTTMILTKTVSWLSKLTIVALISLSISGCKNTAIPDVQPEKNSTNINNIREQVNQNENITITNSQNQEVQTNNRNSVNDVDQFGLQEGMLYKQAREILLQKGWQPNLLGEAADLRDSAVKKLFDLGYKEIKFCSGTGMGLCRFEFTNEMGELLVVSAGIGESENDERLVYRWFIEKKIDINQQNSSAVNYSQELPFIGTKGFNFEGGSGTGRSITIEADGTTIVKIHGTMSSSVEYSGKFSNPILFADGRVLLLKDNKIYLLRPNGEIAQGCKGEETPCDSELYELSLPTILDGFYAMGGTDQGLEVAGKKYRYYSEGGEKEWQPIAELNYIKDGVIFDGNYYWCLLPQNDSGIVCTENGWSSNN